MKRLLGLLVVCKRVAAVTCLLFSPDAHAEVTMEEIGDPVFTPSQFATYSMPWHSEENWWNEVLSTVDGLVDYGDFLAPSMPMSEDARLLRNAEAGRLLTDVFTQDEAKHPQSAVVLDFLLLPNERAPLGTTPYSENEPVVPDAIFPLQWEFEVSQDGVRSSSSFVTNPYPPGVHTDLNGNRVDFTNIEAPLRGQVFWANWDRFSGTSSPVGNYEWRLEVRDANNDGWLISFDYSVVEAPSGVPGDFDHDGDLGIGDLELLERHNALNGTNEALDLDRSGRVDVDDLHLWIKHDDYRGTWFGDSDLSGRFDTGDLVTVFQAGTYEADLGASWRTGDWNADGRFDSADLVLAFQDGGYDPHSQAWARAVPEPSSVLTVMIGLLLMTRLRGGRKPAAS